MEREVEAEMQKLKVASPTKHQARADDVTCLGFSQSHSGASLLNPGCADEQAGTPPKAREEEDESEQDAAEDRERLRRLGGSSDDDSGSDQESLSRRAERANDAIADFQRARQRAKQRLAQAKAVAAERAAKSTRCVCVCVSDVCVCVCACVSDVCVCVSNECDARLPYCESGVTRREREM